MNYLIIGGNGREHAIIKSLKNSNNKIYCISNFKNFGIEQIINEYIIQDINSNSILKLCILYDINIVIIGSEKYLNTNIPDTLLKFNINCFGPTSFYSQLELDKGFARNLISKINNNYNPKFKVFNSYDKIKITEYLNELNEKYVIKYSGIKGGKGVKISGEHLNSIDEALFYCLQIIDEGHDIVIEEKLIGDEFSFQSFCDGKNLLHTIPIRDYKRLKNYNMGPNTGSMGSISCSNHLLPFLDTNDILTVKNINQLVIDKLNNEIESKFYNTGNNIELKQIINGYKGIIYGSYIKTNDGIKVIEFNSRFGDPESLNLFELMETDINEIIENMFLKKLNTIKISFKNEYSLCKYVVPQGYPINPVKDSEIFIEDINHDKLIFSSVELNGNNYIQKGSRILAYVCSGNNINDLIKESETELKKIYGLIEYRNDIGKDISNLLLTNNNKPHLKLNYKESGVDIENANTIVENIGNLIKKTLNNNCINEIGDYSGMYDLSEINFKYNNPILITSMDGVGTKTKMVSDLISTNPNNFNISNYINLGKDIVSHSINDIIVKGANPLFFTDYIASSKLDKSIISKIIEGMVENCRSYSLPILGGETAEMPNIYCDNSYDIVGSIVGVCEKDLLINGKNSIKENDICISLPSDSPHTNGYSLIRKLFEKYKYNLEKIETELNIDKDFIQWLVQPHRCYFNEIMLLINNSVKINGLVHITGGGFIDNVPRVVPNNLKIEYSCDLINYNFKKLQSIMNIDDSEMHRTFNCGIGMIIIINSNNLQLLESLYKENNIDYKIIGDIVQK